MSDSQRSGVNHRLFYLDSARGVAALSVMIWHFLVMFIPRDSKGLLLSPLHTFYYGEADVLFFFIHSGFILCFAYNNQFYPLTFGTVIRFLIERIFRILPLYLFVLAISYLVQQIWLVQSSGTLTGHSSYLWPNVTDLGMVVRQPLRLFLPNIQAGNPLIPQEWTLSVELLAGACIPVMFFFIRRSVFAFFLSVLILSRYFNTYVFEFAIGVFLYHNKAALIELWASLGSFSKIGWLSLGLIGYTCLFQFGSLFSPENIFLSYSFDRVIVCFGCFLLFWILLASKRTQAILSLNPLVFLGKICYSMYLWHILWLIVLALPTRMFFAEQLMMSDTFSLVACAIIFLLSTIAVSVCSYKLIERPFNLLGKKLTQSGKIQGSKPSP